METPVGLRCGCTGVLWRVVGRRREGGDKLIKVQSLVENGAVGSHTGSVGGVRPMWEEHLQDISRDHLHAAHGCGQGTHNGGEDIEGTDTEEEILQGQPHSVTVFLQWVQLQCLPEVAASG